MQMRGWLVAGLGVILFLMLSSAIFAKSNEVASSTKQVVLYLGQKEAVVNGNEVTASSPPKVIAGRTFVPAKFLADVFDFALHYDAGSRTITMTLPNQSMVLIDMRKQSVLVDGMPMAWTSVATIEEGRLLVGLGWICDQLGAKYTYENALKKITIQYVRPPESIYDEDSNNSDPTAKFALDKPSYRIGEPVKYIDLSYDADGDGIVRYEWSGNQEAFFTAGSHPVSLTVTDKAGNVSKRYTRHVIVDDQPFLTKEQFPFYYYEVGRFMPLSDAQKSKYKRMTSVVGQRSDGEARVLLVSDSPETIVKQGILYQDRVSGKARLYAHHMNGTKEKLHLAIMVTNHDNHTVELKTTNKGEVYPTLYTHLIGHQASVDFLLQDPYEERMTLAPGETRIFKQMPVLLPQQGVNMIYDVETDGRVLFSFVASEKVSGFEQVLASEAYLPYSGHVRGTFQQANVALVVDGRQLTEDHQLLIGDGVIDPFVQGFDPMRGEPVENRGNYGVTYKVTITNPDRMAIALLPRGGSYKGALRINGEIVLAPKQGIMTAYDGMLLLARTTGDESAVTMEFIPPAGSALPISLVFYKLTET